MYFSIQDSELRAFKKKCMYTPNFYQVQGDLEMTGEYSDDTPKNTNS